MKDDRVYLLHIMKCISRVEEDTVGGREEFFESAKTRDAVIRNLQILAESSQRISPELKARHPDVDWKNMKGFRNILVHDYLGLDLEKIWMIVENDIPNLKKQATSILAETE